MGCISECCNCGERENHPCDSSGNFHSIMINQKCKTFCFDCIDHALHVTFGSKVEK